MRAVALHPPPHHLGREDLRPEVAPRPRRLGPRLALGTGTLRPPRGPRRPLRPPQHAARQPSPRRATAQQRPPHRPQGCLDETALRLDEGEPGRPRRLPKTGPKHAPRGTSPLRPRSDGTDRRLSAGRLAVRTPVPASPDGSESPRSEPNGPAREPNRSPRAPWRASEPLHLTSTPPENRPPPVPRPPDDSPGTRPGPPPTPRLQPHEPSLQHRRGPPPHQGDRNHPEWAIGIIRNR